MRENGGSNGFLHDLQVISSIVTIIGAILAPIAFYFGNFPISIILSIITTFALVIHRKVSHKKHEPKFCESYLEIDNNIEIDGSSKLTRIIEVEVFKGTLASRDYRISLSGNTTLSGYSSEITKISGISDIIINTITIDSQNAIYIVKFSPELNSRNNPKIKYKIEESAGKGTFLMTRDEILDCIKEGKWVLNEPYAFMRYFVRNPIKKLITIVNLPEKYKITTNDDFWDIVIGDSNSKAYDEYKRLKKMKCFSQDIKWNKRVMKLEVNNPKVGLSYMIKWIPPAKEEYNRVLGDPSP